MAELINPSGYHDFTLETLKTPDGITRLNSILRQLAQNLSSDGETVRIYQGYGTPEGSVAAGIGSIYMRIDGSTDTSVYRKESGSGDTGWVAVKAPASLPLSVANGGTGSDLSATAQGAMLYFSAAGTISVLGAGTSGQYLQTRGANANPIWATANIGVSLLSTTTVSNAASTGDITLTSGKAYKIFVKGSLITNGVNLYLRFNADSGNNYDVIKGGFNNNANSTFAKTTGAAQIQLDVGTATMSNSASFEIVMDLIPDQDSANNKMAFGSMRYYDGANISLSNFFGRYQGSAAITSFVILASSGNITSTVWTYEYSGT